jgi:hypothetical protein
MCLFMRGHIADTRLLAFQFADIPSEIDVISGTLVLRETSVTWSRRKVSARGEVVVPIPIDNLIAAPTPSTPRRGP